jgi:hypothetical protein
MSTKIGTRPVLLLLLLLLLLFRLLLLCSHQPAAATTTAAAATAAAAAAAAAAIAAALHYNTPQSAIVTSTLGTPFADATSLSAGRTNNSIGIHVRRHTCTNSADTFDNTPAAHSAQQPWLGKEPAILA